MSRRQKREGHFGMEAGSERRKFSLYGLVLAGLAFLGLISSMDN